MKSVATIAVGYDGSPDARAALRWSLQLARALDAKVAVVHARGMLEHLDATSHPEEMRRDLSVLAQECHFDEANLQWFVDDGDACSVLLRAGEEPLSADLLVVGSRGRGKRAGFLLGSTSLEVAQHSLTPVVIVPSAHAMD
ncbi:MAG TPA: universal stress protein [Acidimicrobiales bacterium]|nr:universal stress protein [Acidimicrobiales bacterium]